MVSPGQEPGGLGPCRPRLTSQANHTISESNSESTEQEPVPIQAPSMWEELKCPVLDQCPSPQGDQPQTSWGPRSMNTWEPLLEKDQPSQAAPAELEGVPGPTGVTQSCSVPVPTQARGSPDPLPPQLFAYQGLCFPLPGRPGPASVAGGGR
ncbi:hypothetical protein H920_01931 [Fukomys damarensis]|uniref:Uncharacterized protein n=1 Tax=Fukomys damarensis TaxID=885580 RepID=A0A091E2G5_FUKDA|nr:hypothetical protein H920_01931 [Fukomys damarensis]